MVDLTYPKSLVASSHENIARNCKVFNINELDYFLWVKIEPPLSSSYYLYKIEEVKQDGLHEVMFKNMFVRESPTWMKIAKDYLNLDIGQHAYKMSFVNTETDILVSLYFSYIIQNDNPDKPYVYMNREEVAEDDRCNSGE